MRESQVAVTRNHQRGGSDGFELRCDNGQPLRVRCDGLLREMGPASAGGPCGNRVKDQALMEYALAAMGQFLFAFCVNLQLRAKPGERSLSRAAAACSMRNEQWQRLNAWMVTI